MNKVHMHRYLIRRRAAVLLAALLVLPLAGCTLSNRGSATELQADETGRLVHTIVEKTDKSYTIEELEAYIGEQVDAYNSGTAAGDGREASAAADAEADTDSDAKSKSDSASKSKSDSASKSKSGDARIELESCRSKDGSTQIQLAYDSYADYMRFNGTRCFFGTIREAEDAGYTFDGGFLDEKGREAEDAAATIAERAAEWKVLIVEEPMRVRVPDKILYTSRNMETTGRMTAVYEKSGTETDETDADAESGAESSTDESQSGTVQISSDDPLAGFAINDFDLAYVIFK